MRSSFFAFFFAGVLTCGIPLWAQDSTPSSSKQGSSTPDSRASHPQNPNLEAPRPDRGNADAVPSGESSSKETAIDLTPPAQDVKAHPESSDMLKDAGP